MHSAAELDSGDFEYLAGGDPVARTDVMPSITETDRVGVVMDTATEGIGAGNFVLSAVTAFYDRLRARSEEFFEYPDYYTFQATSDPADYGMLDVYPDHKSVTVESDAEAILRAITDRAITVLLVPDVQTQSPDIADITRTSAARRISHCYLYSGDGRVDDAEFSIRLPRDPAADWYRAVAESVATVPDAETVPEPGTGLSVDTDGARIVQEFRRLSLDDALSRLPPGTVS